MSKWTIRKRILASFGIILTLMVVMAVIAYTRLSAIERNTRTVKTDSLPGLYTSAGVRSAWNESYVLTQRLVFIDADPASIKRDETRIAETKQALDQFAQGYQKTLFIDREPVRFNNFNSVPDQYQQLLAN